MESQQSKERNWIAQLAQQADLDVEDVEGVSRVASKAQTLSSKKRKLMRDEEDDGDMKQAAVDQVGMEDEIDLDDDEFEDDQPSKNKKNKKRKIKKSTDFEDDENSNVETGDEDDEMKWMITSPSSHDSAEVRQMRGKLARLLEVPLESLEMTQSYRIPSSSSSSNYNNGGSQKSHSWEKNANKNAVEGHRSKHGRFPTQRRSGKYSARSNPVANSLSKIKRSSFVVVAK